MWTLEYPANVSGVYKYKEFNYAVTLPTTGFSYTASADVPTNTFSGTYATVSMGYLYFSSNADYANTAGALNSNYVATITAGNGILITQPTPNNFVISATGSSPNWYSEVGLSNALSQSLNFPTGYTQSPTTAGFLNIKENTIDN